jgi:hypothetical protein
VTGRRMPLLRTRGSVRALVAGVAACGPRSRPRRLPTATAVAGAAAAGVVLSSLATDGGVGRLLLMLLPSGGGAVELPAAAAVVQCVGGAERTSRPSSATREEERVAEAQERLARLRTHLSPATDGDDAAAPLRCVPLVTRRCRPAGQRGALCGWAASLVCVPGLRQGARQRPRGRAHAPGSGGMGGEATAAGDVRPG